MRTRSHANVRSPARVCVNCPPDVCLWSKAGARALAHSHKYSARALRMPIRLYSEPTDINSSFCSGHYANANTAQTHTRTRRLPIAYRDHGDVRIGSYVCASVRSFLERTLNCADARRHDDEARAHQSYAFMQTRAHAFTHKFLTGETDRTNERTKYSVYSNFFIWLYIILNRVVRAGSTRCSWCATAAMW